jgi:hypothetical protein
LAGLTQNVILRARQPYSSHTKGKKIENLASSLSEFSLKKLKPVYSTGLH